MRGRAAFVGLAVVLGVVLRLIYPGTIEFKSDEAYTFGRVMAVGHTEPWPSLGMPSSQEGVRSPALSVWVFVALGRLFSVTTPVDLARAIAVTNCVALVLLFAFAVRIVPNELERRAWLWGTALVAVSPISTILTRKIWAQSILPIFCVCFLVGWFGRRERWGAFLWGLMGAVLGQIHMAGFFFVPAVAGWTFAFRRKEPKWNAWVVGSVLGALPALPWIKYVLSGEAARPASHIAHIVRFEFYQYFFSDPTGAVSEYSLGPDFLDYLRYPILAGQSTYLVGLIHVCLIGVSLRIAFSLLQHWKRRNWREVFRDDGTDTGLLLSATLVGMGGVMTALMMSLYRHYMLVTFPLPFVWAARAALRDKLGERHLAVLWAGSLLASVALLYYLHVNGGSPRGDFGPSYPADGALQKMKM